LPQLVAHWQIAREKRTERTRHELKSLIEKFAQSFRKGSWAATARQALLYALPLGFVALLAAQWLDADYLALRENSRRRAQTAAEAIGATAAGEVSDLAAFARANVNRAAAEGLDPPNALWRVIAGYNQDLLVFIRAGDLTLFPPEDPLAAPKMWEEKTRTLIGVASLLREGDFVDGWFPDAAGEYYFECVRIGAQEDRKESCVALNARFIFPDLTAALAKRAKGFPGWAFRLRDPFGQAIWRDGVATEGYESFPMHGALRGWAIDVVGPRAPGHSVFGRLALAAPLALVWLLLVFQARRAEKARLDEAAARAALATRLSHDLRTPLANLKLYAELISRKAGEIAGLDRYCAVLTEEIDRLDALAGETIFGDRQMAAAPKLVPADPCELARRVVARYERLLSVSNCRCETDCAAAERLRFDASAFERILINLLDNARKYAPGRIDVAVSWRDGLLMIEVRDHGAAGPGGGDARPSHGLGLSIVQELARANGGDFSLSGADPGLRARATIRALAEGEAG
jgi:signal transduction histidine kinase